jgi:hypothetical protein
VHGLPAGATLGVAPIAGDAMADRRDPPELLGVDVEQLARPLPLVAHDWRLRLECRQLAEPEAAQAAADRRDRHGQLARDRRAAQALPPPALDLGHTRGRHLMSTVELVGQLENVARTRITIQLGRQSHPHASALQIALDLLRRERFDVPFRPTGVR